MTPKTPLPEAQTSDMQQRIAVMDVTPVLNLIGDERPDYVCVFGADNIYRMDPRQMVEAHRASGAGVTVAALRVPRDQANQ